MAAGLEPLLGPACWGISVIASSLVSAFTPQDLWAGSEFLHQVNIIDEALGWKSGLQGGGWSLLGRLSHSRPSPPMAPYRHVHTWRICIFYVRKTHCCPQTCISPTSAPDCGSRRRILGGL
eukprot:1161326-Pelagomonas_calceolata.AAC.1